MNTFRRFELSCRFISLCQLLLQAFTKFYVFTTIHYHYNHVLRTYFVTLKGSAWVCGETTLQAAYEYWTLIMLHASSLNSTLYCTAWFMSILFYHLSIANSFVLLIFTNVHYTIINKYTTCAKHSLSSTRN